MNEVAVPENKKRASALWDKVKRRRKRIILLLILLLLAAGGLFTFFKLHGRASDETTYSFIRTTTLSSGSLSNTVSTTGTIESQEMSTVSYSGDSTAKTPKVKEILVAVGDEVKAGDVIIQLDTTDLLKQIEKAESSLTESQETAQDNYDDAASTYDEAQGDILTQLGSFSTSYLKMVSSYAPYLKALLSIRSYQSTYEDAVSAWQSAGAAYNQAKASGSGDLTALEEALVEAADAMNSAKDALTTAKVNSNFDELERTYTDAKSSYEKEHSTYEQVWDQYGNAQDQVENAQKALDKVDDSETLEDLLSSLDACSLKAETDGKVTSINTTVGSTPVGSVAVVQDLERLKVTITIPEADINKVSVGMSCIITSDATEGNINGTLSQIDPISSNGSFSAEVTVDDEDTGLWAGMNASVEIIISQSDAGFSVPADAVGNDDDGKGNYVYRQTGGEGVDMTFEKVYVTIGDSNDYYVQILSDKLAMGDVIRSSADLIQGIETIDAEESGGFSLSSLFGGGMSSGGDMPSGGGMPSGGNMSGSSGMPSGGNMPSGGSNGGGMPGGMPGGMG